MTRPESHREIEPSKRCGNCRFSCWPEWKDDLLCFFGDDIHVESGDRKDRFFIELEGVDVNIADGDEYDRIWGGRVVDPHLEVCDEWQPNQ